MCNIDVVIKRNTCYVLHYGSNHTNEQGRTILILRFKSLIRAKKYRLSFSSRYGNRHDRFTENSGLTYG